MRNESEKFLGRRKFVGATVGTLFLLGVEACGRESYTTRNQISEQMKIWNEAISTLNITTPHFFTPDNEDGKDIYHGDNHKGRRMKYSQSEGQLIYFEYIIDNGGVVPDYSAAFRKHGEEWDVEIVYSPKDKPSKNWRRDIYSTDKRFTSLTSSAFENVVKNSNVFFQSFNKSVEG